MRPRLPIGCKTANHGYSYIAYLAVVSLSLHSHKSATVATRLGDDCFVSPSLFRIYLDILSIAPNIRSPLVARKFQEMLSVIRRSRLNNFSVPKVRISFVHWCICFADLFAC